MPMHTYPNKNYSLIYMWIAIGIICCLSIAGPRFIRPALDEIIGDLNLDSFEKAFQNLRHPTGTEYLSSRSELGDFGGSQLGCDLFLGEIRRYEVSQDGILTDYEEQDVRGYPIQVVTLEAGQIPGGTADLLPAPLNELAGWELPAGVDQGALYLVYVIIQDDESTLKFICP